MECEIAKRVYAMIGSTRHIALFSLFESIQACERVDREYGKYAHIIKQQLTSLLVSITTTQYLLFTTCLHVMNHYPFPPNAEN